MFRKIREKEEQLLMPLFLKGGRGKLCLSGSPGRTCKGGAPELQPRVPWHKCHRRDLTTLRRRLGLYSGPSTATCSQDGPAASAALLSVTGSASSHTLNCDPTCLHFPFAERWFRVFQMDLTPTYHDPTGERCVLLPCPLLLERKPSPSTEPVPDLHNSPQPRTQGFTPRS